MVTLAGDVYCYHFNGVGSTVAITNSSQTVVNKYSYDPFGNIASQSETVISSQPFKYVGQYGVMTEPNGFYYMKARYYDPTVGRFISEDPIGFAGGDTNLMAYVGNNPVTGIDPEGLCANNGKDIANKVYDYLTSEEAQILYGAGVIIYSSVGITAATSVEAAAAAGTTMALGIGMVIENSVIKLIEVGTGADLSSIPSPWEMIINIGKGVRKAYKK